MGSVGVPVVAIVLAAGTGSRFGGPKQLADLAGRPVVAHSVETFAASADRIVVVAGDDIRPAVEGLFDGRPEVAVVTGGRTRSESSQRGLAAIDGDDANVLIHDAARPLVDAELVRRCLAALEDAEAVVPVVPPSDTVVVTDGEQVTDVLVRDRLAHVQTPQGFRLRTIRAAYARAADDPGFAATDDASVVARYLPDVVIRLVAGTARNLKLTSAEDLAVAEALLRS